MIRTITSDIRFPDRVYPVLFLILFGLSGILSGCNPDQLSTYSSEEPPVITSVSPDSGRYQTAVTITGMHFGPETRFNKVQFNGIEAEVTSASTNELVAEVPERAGSGPVTVTVDGKESDPVSFTYLLTIDVQTWAGSVRGFANGQKEEARFNNPWGLAINSRGELYVGDSDNFAIRIITYDNQVNTHAGRATVSGYIDGESAEALFSQPMGITLAQDGTVYVADSFNHVIRSINLGREVSTFAGIGFAGSREGHRLEAMFNQPADVAYSTSDQFIYIADAGNSKIRKIGPDNNTSTLAGNGRRGHRDGIASEAQFELPLSIALGPEESVLYVADFLGHRIRSVDINTGKVATISGDGTAGFMDGPVSQARFNRPAGIVVDSDGAIFVSDSGNHAIRMIKEGRVTTIAGKGEPGMVNGAGKEAMFDTPYHLELSSAGTFLYVSDWANHLVRRITIR